MFTIGQKVHCVGEGTFIVKRVEKKSIGGVDKDFYILSAVNQPVTRVIPCEDPFSNGVRELISAEEADKVKSFIAEGCVEIDTLTWNKRYRVCQEMLGSGDIFEYAWVYLYLRAIENHKDLSFGERKMLDRACVLIEDELFDVTGAPVNLEEIRVKGQK